MLAIPMCVSSKTARGKCCGDLLHVSFMFAEPHSAATSPDLSADAHELVVHEDKNPRAADSVGFSINERDSKAHPENFCC